MGQAIGYSRVSTKNQNLERQLNGVKLKKVYEEKVSGKNLDRPQLKECMDYLRAGDVLHIHSIDRLARNLKDLQEIVEELVSKGVSVNFHNENLVFDGNDSAIQKMMLQMMGSFAEFEKNIINQRRIEGVKIAKEKGVKFGRKMKLSDEDISEIKRLVKEGADKKALAGEYGVSRGTIYNIMKR